MMHSYFTSQVDCDYTKALANDSVLTNLTNVISGSSQDDSQR